MGNIIERTFEICWFTKSCETLVFLFFFTFHVANGTVAFTDLEVRGVVDLKRYFLTMAATFVLYFCVHDILRFWQFCCFEIIKAVSFQVRQFQDILGVRESIGDKYL